MIRGRLRRRQGAGRRDPADAELGGELVEIDPSELSGLFAAPKWLRDAGLMSWLLVGITVLLVGVVWLLALTQVIVLPVLTAGIVAAVAAPLVRWFAAHRIPRALGAVIVLLAIVAIGLGLVLVVLGGIASQASEVSDQLTAAADRIESWLEDAGVAAGDAASANRDVSAGLVDAKDALLGGLTAGISALSTLAFFLGITALSLFFLLKDGPEIRSWTERHLALPDQVAHTITKRMLQSLRGYFTGVAIVAAFNAAVVTIGALALGVPLAGTIAVVTFIGAFIPYLGAWAAAGFAVLIALGGAGPEEAGAMIVVQLLANGILQQLVQPFAMGAALGIHPLAVLVVTIAGGALFGAVGLILAAPVVAAATRISADLARARAAESTHAAEASGDAPAPATA
ncbi:MAG TPA: AI-2E family transporter [Solirubrobacterales bacterium]